MSSKLKFILGFLAVVAGFLLIRIGLVFRDNSTSTTAYIGNTVSSQTQTSPQDNPLTRDSDHDGLPDREEIIYGTDPFNPDTDGDGYKDGEEVMTGHNPLDPNDNPKTRPGNFGSKQPNLTDSTANLTVASLIGGDGTLNPSQVKRAGVNDIISGLSTQATILLSIDPIKDSDIKTTIDNSQGALDSYVSKVAPIISTEVFNPSLLTKMVNSDADLQTAIDNYQQADQALRTMEVPSSWKDVHKDLINSSEQFIKLAQALKGDQVNTDPVKALFALKGMQGVLTNLSHATINATDLAKSQNISPKTLNILLSR